MSSPCYRANPSQPKGPLYGCQSSIGILVARATRLGIIHPRILGKKALVQLTLPRLSLSVSVTRRQVYCKKGRPVLAKGRALFILQDNYEA